MDPRLVTDRLQRYTCINQGSLCALVATMKCTKCEHENTVEAKFCEQCAAPLGRTCANCASKVSSAAKFCPQCGHVLKPDADNSRFASPRNYTPQYLADKILISRSTLEGERKQVTVLFADIKGSMELFADRDPEHAQKLLDPVLDCMIEAVHHYEGTVNRVVGSWPSSARRLRTRIMRCALVLLGFGCKTPSRDIQTKCGGLMG